ncbi:hypothetical protein B296_00045409 [Ensete ventricosum]|uniref:Uncharacterized protein n=1 Tax=Ensete ventricosum TaxID=4639 RepID=A0A426X2X6_ENSVE|nr:hypothetical protein B296_00045409 [Ensete ventricosum]
MVACRRPLAREVAACTASFCTRPPLDVATVSHSWLTRVRLPLDAAAAYARPTQRATWAVGSVTAVVSALFSCIASCRRSCTSRRHRTRPARPPLLLHHSLLPHRTHTVVAAPAPFAAATLEPAQPSLLLYRSTVASPTPLTVAALDPLNCCCSCTARLPLHLHCSLLSLLHRSSSPFLHHSIATSPTVLTAAAPDPLDRRHSYIPIAINFWAGTFEVEISFTFFSVHAELRYTYFSIISELLQPSYYHIRLVVKYDKCEPDYQVITPSDSWLVDMVDPTQVTDRTYRGREWSYSRPDAGKVDTPHLQTHVSLQGRRAW